MGSYTKDATLCPVHRGLIAMSGRVVHISFLSRKPALAMKILNNLQKVA